MTQGNIKALDSTLSALTPEEIEAVASYVQSIDFSGDDLGGLFSMGEQLILNLPPPVGPVELPIPIPPELRSSEAPMRALLPALIPGCLLLDFKKTTFRIGAACPDGICSIDLLSYPARSLSTL